MIIFLNSYFKLSSPFLSLTPSMPNTHTHTLTHSHQFTDARVNLFPEDNIDMYVYIIGFLTHFGTQNHSLMGKHE